MNPIEDSEEPFDFSKYRVPPTQGSEIPTKMNAEIEGEFDFNQYRINEPPTKIKEVGRHATRTGSRVLETIGGFPGDIVNFSKFVGESLPKGPVFLQKEPNFAQKGAQKIAQSLPTSHELKEFSSYLTSGFTDPQGAAEELGDELTSLATVLVSPSKAVSGFSSLLKTLGSSLLKSSGIKGSGKGAEILGADSKTKTGVELGTLFLTGLLSGKTASKFVTEQYQKARSQIPKNAVVQTTDLAKALDRVDTELAKGISTNTKKEVRNAIKGLKGKAQGGYMEADEIVQSFHDINERMNSKKLFDELTTSERKQLKSRYDLFKNEVRSEIANYGKYNPEFYETWKGANEGFEAVAQSKKLGNWIQSKTGSLPKHLVGSVALDLFLGYPWATAGVAGSYATVKVGELMAQIAKSPKLRDHYMKVILEASNENLPGVINNLNALNKESKRLEKINSRQDQRNNE